MSKNLFLTEVTEMARIDQDLRFSAVHAMKARKKAKPSMEDYLVYMADWVHGQRIQSLIKKFGYPSIKSFGKKGMADFWLLIQHQDYNIDLQKRCLKNCSFSAEQYAHLKDRILVNQGKKQIYGTQYTGKFDKRKIPILWPVRDAKKLSQRRQKVGL